MARIEKVMMIYGRECRAQLLDDGWEIYCPSLFLLVNEAESLNGAMERMASKIKEDSSPEDLP